MISPEVKAKIEILKKYFATKPILKVWLFGSCSRGEERADSDYDFLIEYDKNAHVGLLAIGGIYIDLKDLLQREVDLVEDGTLLPFAKDSAERDKVLIYERAS